jgi:hypothetical protein
MARGRAKTTFAKLNREAKVAEKRHLKALRKEQRRAEGGVTEHVVEDLSHLDVAVVQGVEPDVTVKR